MDYVGIKCSVRDLLFDVNSFYACPANERYASHIR